jgi:riboflavin synthase
MFTGIIQSIGTITAVDAQGADARVHVATGKLDLAHAQVGDSIAVNGVCLTATAFVNNGFWADVSGETLARTTFGEIAVGCKVNLEQSLTPTTRLGGHLVSGHVDGVGTVINCRDQGRSLRFVIQVPPTLAKYIAEKGSICVEGVSLTVNKVDGASFDLNIVPHTLQETTLGEWVVGSRVNLEVDILARYLERLLLGEDAAQSRSPVPVERQSAGITHGFLVEHGFIKS